MCGLNYRVIGRYELRSLVSDWVAIDGIHHELEFGRFFTNYLQAYMTLLINGVRLQAVFPTLPI